MIPDFVLFPNPQNYFDDNFVVFDFETTNLDKGSALNPDNRLLMATWYVNTTGKTFIKWANEFEQDELIYALEQARVVVAHNAKFELHWLNRMGVDISRLLVYDTMLGEYVLHSNKKVKIGLGPTAVRYGLPDKDKYVDLCISGGVCPSELPKSMLEDRNKLDVYQTKEIMLQQRQRLADDGKLGVLYTKCLFTPVLADIETQGLELAADKVREEYFKCAAEASKLRQEIDQLTGGINPKSPDQVAEYLYDTLGFEELKKGGEAIRTPKGKRKTDEATILKLPIETEEQNRFIKLKKKYASVSAALSKTLEFFYGVVEERGGRFFGVFNQSVTATQRLSSSGRPIQFNLFPKPKSVQFQNLPRIYKKLFTIHDDDYLFCEPDGAQLEFRVAAHEGRDVRAIQDILDGMDIHRFSASVLNAVTEEQVTKDQRQNAKPDTFKPLYGGQSGTPAQKKYYAAFRERYQGITKTQNNWISHVVNHKSLVTETGLEFYWPNTKRVGDYVINREAICNYPVQYLATGEIIPIAIIYLWHYLLDKGLKSKILNTVHDSSPMKVHKDEVEIVKELAQRAYLDDVYNYLKEVYGIHFLAPLGLEIKFGKYWGEGEAFVYTKLPPTKLEGVNYG
jgi:DNA polymerase I-like protein with 3'-5' exonuclease and polymerase domains